MNKLLLILFVLLIIPLVSAVQTQTTIYQDVPDLTIVYPKYDIMPEQQDIILPFDVLNSSYGRETNETSDCIFFMVDGLGLGVAGGNLTYDEILGYWYYNFTADLNNQTQILNYYVHCNSTNYEYGFVSSSLTFINGGSPLEDHNNFSFLIVAMVFLFITAMVGGVFLITKKVWIQIIMIPALMLCLTTLLRFTSWFIAITNPVETSLIHSIDFFYSLAIRGLYLSVAGALLFLVIFTINSIRTRPERKEKEEWDNWGR